MFVAVFFFLTPLRPVVAGGLTASLEPICGSASVSVYGSYGRLTCSDCPWYLKVSFILVAEKSKLKDPARLWEGIGRETQTLEFDKAPVILAAEYYEQAAKAYPQYRELIDSEEMCVRKQFLNNDGSWH